MTHRFGGLRWPLLVAFPLLVLGPCCLGSTAAAAAAPQRGPLAGLPEPGTATPGIRHELLPGSIGSSTRPLADRGPSGIPHVTGPTPAHFVDGRSPRPASTSEDLISTNWSGQIALGSTFSEAAAHWTVPSVVPSSASEYSATWVGVDGVTDGSLIQTGTAQFTSGGETDYYAWYEIIPAASVPIDEPVAPGDAMEASVIEDTPGLWTITISDATQDWVESGDFDYDGQGSSAEWIEEAPTVNGEQSTLADYGVADFTDATLDAFDSGTTYVDPVDMVNQSDQVISYPGPVTAGGDFSVTYGTPRPAITSISPAEGSTTGGTIVTIDGDYLNLQADASVSFGGRSASFLINANGSLAAVAPPGTAGPVNVTVTNPDGTTPTSSADVFTYLSPPAGSGYDLVGSDGGVFVFPPGGGYYGSLPGLHISVDNIVGIVPSSDYQGYLLVGSDGGVFSFGDTKYYGSLPGLHVSVDDIVGIVPTSDGKGYFLVGRDGGVFSFGDSKYEGSLPGLGLRVDNVAGIAATPDDHGYWVVQTTGTVHAFGDATAYGNAPAILSPVVGIAATADGDGYWVVYADGAVADLGDAADLGSLGITPAAPIVGLVRTSDGHGYWMIGRNGAVYVFGDAPDDGSLPSHAPPVVVDNIVGAVPTSAG